MSPPGFLQYLTTFPQADSVVHAAIRGPLAEFGCKSASLWTHSNYQELVCIGMYGNDSYDVERYSRVSLDLQIPLTESFNTSSTILLPITNVVDAYPILKIDQDFWDDVVEKNGDGDVGHVPIYLEGIPIGAYTFLCDRLNEWSAKSISKLDGLSAALGLWLSNPLSGVRLKPPKDIQEGLTLSPRQRQILSLVGDGKSNSSISAHLGFSESTVKQELQRIMKRLRVHTRTDAAVVARELQLLTPPSAENPEESL